MIQVTDQVPDKCHSLLGPNPANQTRFWGCWDMRLGGGWEELGLKTQRIEHGPLCLKEKQENPFSVMPPAPAMLPLSGDRRSAFHF